MTNGHNVEQVVDPHGDEHRGDGWQSREPDLYQGLRSQMDDPNLNVRLRAVKQLASHGDDCKFPILLDVMLQNDAFMQQTVEKALAKIGATGWMGLLQADDAGWRSRIESNDPILAVAIESRYAQRRIIGVLDQGGCSLPEELWRRYFATAERDRVAYDSALILVDKQEGSISFEAFKKQIKERLRVARQAQVEYFIRGLTDKSETVRLESVMRLNGLRDVSALEPLLGRLVDEHDLVRLIAVRALTKIRDTRAVIPLTELLSRDPAPNVRAEAAFALGQLGDISAVPGLVKALRDLDVEVFKKVVDSLISLQKDVAFDALVKEMLSHSAPEFRAVLIQVMWNFSGNDVVRALEFVVAEDPSPANRVTAGKELKFQLDRNM